MRFRSFLFQLAILLCGFALINAAVRFAARRAPAHALVSQIDKQRRATAQNSATPVTDLALGNSLMVAGLAPKVFAQTREGRRVLQLSLGGTKPIENYATLRYYLDNLPAQTPPPRTLIYGFYDRQLTDTSLLNWDDVSGNKAMVYYTNIETTLPFYAPDGGWTAWKYRLSAPFPVVTDRGQIWGKVEKMRRKISRVGLPAQATNAFGRVEDMGALEPETVPFERDCLREARAGAPFSPPMDAIMKLCAQHNMSVVLVVMPMSSTHRRTYYSTAAWSQYETQLRAQAKHYGAQYVDASDWLEDAQFQDRVHLLKSGAALFTQRLATTPEVAQLALAGK